MITTPRTETMRTRANDAGRHRTRKRLRMVAAIAATGVGTIGMTGTPASADRPVEFEDSMTFTDINPCTGTPMDVTIDSVVRLHEHGDRFVAHVSRTGSTSDGYVMDHSVETALFNGNVFRAALVDNLRDEDGSKFQVRGVLVERDGDVQVDRFTLRCLDR